ncbi:MAG: hypothetical protein KKE30_00900 [Gammaproteobacteria bacterium]|nr:hypothetical protein [Gammaproteobacteria bacterium]MBU1556414.1 hypothetical protein [Gammaproteobacteria bacterium]MBU2072002.1 hypothetical protein [Gammaproteobacteria bacterium]MBU2183913.1 hypothetical protein [Gammaproteobacteria bacterium]MBU2203333.1 hypothetical protein [Gammaproteobacteria bacterium]
MILRFSLLIILIFAVFACNGLEVKTADIKTLVPEEICREKMVFDSDTTFIFSDCQTYDFINQYIVTDSMTMSEFRQFVAEYQLGNEYETTLEQNLLRHFDAMISPIDPNTSVESDENAVLFRTNKHLALFERKDDHWRLTKAVFMQ